MSEATDAILIELAREVAELRETVDRLEQLLAGSPRAYKLDPDYVTTSIGPAPPSP